MLLAFICDTVLVIGERWCERVNIEKIRDVVMEKHANQKRIQGTPYYLHPIAVAELLASKGYDINYQVVGLFHDLLEDTDTTCEELLEVSTAEIVEAVRLVTKETGYQMAEYVNRIEKNDLAKMVKLADRVHNLQEAKFASIHWIRKYLVETKLWYLELAKDTPFEQELNYWVNFLDNEINSSVCDII